ncbi:hypothetical protein COOONC_01330 [Cooperia oncophora]
MFTSRHGPLPKSSELLLEVGRSSHGLRRAEHDRGPDDEVTTAPPIVIVPFEMSPRYTYAVVFIASLLVLQYVAAQSDDMYELQRVVRAPKFIRFGRGGGAKFIRFGRSGTNSWRTISLFGMMP